MVENMPHNAGVAAFSIFLFCLSFLPFPSLALQLNIPTRSSDGGTIYFTWVANNGDPPTAFLQIICGKIKVPWRPEEVQVLDQKLTIDGNSYLTKITFPIDCNLYAFEGPRGDKKIAQSDAFITLAVATAEATIVTTTPTQASSVSPTIPSSFPERPPPIATTPGNVPGNIAFPPSTFTPKTGPPNPQTLKRIPPVTVTTNLVASSTLSFPAGSSTILPSLPIEEHKPTRQAPRGAVIGGVIGGLGFLALLLGLGFLCYRRRRDRLPPSAAHYAANNRDDYNAINDTYRQNDQYRPDVKRNTDYDAAENGTQETAEEAALRRKAEIMDDLIYEAAARDGVKA